ncbi:tripartite tricarboxylate transporter TctB family protein [Bauldia sp.]|uniref:tripartite tricarboxylate transporter TctB family protein n=1 Tax=Bauldia sp. TaxID=2575872 RepID=UPI003BAAD596
MNDQRMARADLVTGAVLFALSVAFVVGSWNMDRLEARRIHPFSAPGVTPGLLGLALGVTSALLVVQAVRKGGLTGWGDLARNGFKLTDAGRRLLGAIVLCLFYPLVLIGTLPYWLATTIFVTGFIFAFEWNQPSPLWQRLAWAFGIGVVVGVGISYVFTELFLVRLP